MTMPPDPFAFVRTFIIGSRMLIKRVAFLGISLAYGYALMAAGQHSLPNAAPPVAIVFFTLLFYSGVLPIPWAILAYRLGVGPLAAAAGVILCILPTCGLAGVNGWRQLGEWMSDGLIIGIFFFLPSACFGYLAYEFCRREDWKTKGKEAAAQ